MEDEQKIEAPEVGTPAPAGSRGKRASTASRKGGRKARAAKPEPGQPAAKGRGYSDGQKTEMLSRIKGQVSEGATVKAAVKDAGITEQTYYRWKQALPAEAQPGANKAEPVATVRAEIETLADLVELEAENNRLRSLLAKKLRAENAELRKRLGLD